MLFKNKATEQEIINLRQKLSEAEANSTVLASQIAETKKLLAQENALYHAKLMEISKLKHEHELQLKTKQFEISHYKDEELKVLQNKIVELQSQVAVLKKENEMQGKIIAVNADIVDIKDLVTNLIGKLPDIKISNLSLSSNKE